MTSERILIDARTLHRSLAREDWVAVDCRSELADVTAGRKLYEQGHLPGAVFLDLDLDLAGPVGVATGRHPLPDVDQIGRTLGRLGIGNAHTVVVYDGGNGALAARAWWTLRWLGQASVRLLDGGIRQWRAMGLPLDAEVVSREPQTFMARPNDALVLTTEELESDLTRIPERHLLDARDRQRYLGEHEPIDPVAGHIPGSISLPFADFVTKEGTWRPLADRAALLEAVLGSDRETAWSVMCGSGVTACHLAISGLEAGFSEPRLYVGSWSEWIRDPGRPIGTLKGQK
jgi:thiosulfate/3-mercaptopyruvate sulfurtransferase